jgi:hypothetical protein
MPRTTTLVDWTAAVSTAGGIIFDANGRDSTNRTNFQNVIRIDSLDWHTHTGKIGVGLIQPGVSSDACPPPPEACLVPA